MCWNVLEDHLRLHLIVFVCRLSEVFRLFCRTKIALNDAIHYVGGHSIIGEPTTNYYTHNVFSLLKMNSGDTASLWGFSYTDPGPKRCFSCESGSGEKPLGALRKLETENFQEGIKKIAVIPHQVVCFFNFWDKKQLIHLPPPPPKKNNHPGPPGCRLGP